MATIGQLPDIESKYGELAGLLGQGLGLAGLYGYNKMQEPTKIEQLMNLYNLPKDKATAIVGQPAEAQKSIIKDLMARQDAQRQGDLLRMAGMSGDNFDELYSSLGASAQGGAGMPNFQNMSNTEKLGFFQSQGANKETLDRMQKQFSEEENQRIKREKLSNEEIRDLQSRADPIITKLADRYRDVKRLEKTLVQMRKLNEVGDFSNPKWINAIRKFGLDWDSLMNPDDTTFIKLRNDFLPSMRALFGADVSNAQMEQFLKGIPDLTQTKEGREVLIDMLDLSNKATKNEWKALGDIKKEYGRKLPTNIDYEILKRVEKASDQDLKKFAQLHERASGISRYAQENPGENSIFGFDAEPQRPEFPGAQSNQGRVSFAPDAFEGQKITPESDRSRGTQKYTDEDRFVDEANPRDFPIGFRRLNNDTGEIEYNWGDRWSTKKPNIPK